MKRPARNTRKRLRTSIVGQGDDWIPVDGWDVPISKYKDLLEIYSMAESHEIDLPLDQIRFALASGRCCKTALSSISLDGLECFLSELLSPYLDVKHKHWDSNSPGASGIYKTAVLTLGDLRLINRRLQIAQTALITWHRASGLPPITKKANLAAEKNSVIPNEQGKTKEELPSKDAEDRAQAWEENIANEIIAHIDSKVETPFVIFHFLSYRNRVFFIQKIGWFHSIPGNEVKVAKIVVNRGIELIPVEIVASARGWIPYFARNKAEEGRLGWNEETIQLKAISNDENDNLLEAVQAVRLISR